MQQVTATAGEVVVAKVPTRPLCPAMFGVQWILFSEWTTEVFTTEEARDLFVKRHVGNSTMRLYSIPGEEVKS